MVFTEFRTHSARKNTSIFMLLGSLSGKQKRVLKLASKLTIKAHGLVDLSKACKADESSLALSEGMNFILFFSLFFFN